MMYSIWRRIEAIGPHTQSNHQKPEKRVPDNDQCPQSPIAKFKLLIFVCFFGLWPFENAVSQLIKQTIQTEILRWWLILSNFYQWLTTWVIILSSLHHFFVPHCLTYLCWWQTFERVVDDRFLPPLEFHRFPPTAYRPPSVDQLRPGKCNDRQMSSVFND